MEPRDVAALEPDEAGKTRYLRVNLTPGRYELFCNMAGHYLGGMHRKVDGAVAMRRIPSFRPFATPRPADGRRDPARVRAFLGAQRRALDQGHVAARRTGHGGRGGGAAAHARRALRQRGAARSAGHAGRSGLHRAACSRASATRPARRRRRRRPSTATTTRPTVARDDRAGDPRPAGAGAAPRGRPDRDRQAPCSPAARSPTFR